MSDWLATAIGLAEQGEPAILASVIATRGSAPRDTGTRMIVCEERCYGTIGGGQLEFRAMAEARELLGSYPFGQTAGCRHDVFDGHCDGAVLRRLPLGAALGQCCGGMVQLLLEPLTGKSATAWRYIEERQARGEPVVMITEVLPNGVIHKQLLGRHDSIGRLGREHPSALQQARCLLEDASFTVDAGEPRLWFERLADTDFRLCLFGAGHVGRAVVAVMSQLPCRIDWVDSRVQEFPSQLPERVQARVVDDPVSVVDALPAGTWVLIMTHSHALDEALCARVLPRHELPWCGLIGSASKRRRFEHRLQLRGLDEADIGRLLCPIGLPGLGGKQPGEIAVSVAAQMLQYRQQGWPAARGLVSRR